MQAAGCSYGQFKVDQGPRYDNTIRKRKPKRKRKRTGSK